MTMDMCVIEDKCEAHLSTIWKYKVKSKFNFKKSYYSLLTLQKIPIRIKRL